MSSLRPKARAIRRLLHDGSGQFALMTAIMTPVAITLAAFAVDAGSLYVEKRQAQALADLAAITAAANIDGAQLAARTTLQDNGAGDAPGDSLVATTGHYDPVAPVGNRFVAGGMPVNAVKVEYRTTGARYFAGAIIPPPPIGVSAVAATSADAAFSIGSRLAALDGGVVNALLGGLTGSSISLSVMDYNALLNADVSLLAFLGALAVELDLTAASYNEVLGTDATIGQIARALSKTPGLPGDVRSAAAPPRRASRRQSGKDAPALAAHRVRRR